MGVTHFRAGGYSSTARAPQIWGERDLSLAKSLSATMPRCVPNVRIPYLQTASHWVQMGEPDEVSRMMCEFLKGSA